MRLFLFVLEHRLGFFIPWRIVVAASKCIVRKTFREKLATICAAFLLVSLIKISRKLQFWTIKSGCTFVGILNFAWAHTKWFSYAMKCKVINIQISTNIFALCLNPCRIMFWCCNNVGSSSVKDNVYRLETNCQSICGQETQLKVTLLFWNFCFQKLKSRNEHSLLEAKRVRAISRLGN